MIFFLQEAIKLSQPVVMGYVIGHFLSGSPNTYRVAWINAGIMMVLGFMFFAPQAMYFYLSSCLAMRLRAACSALIFRKVAFYVLYIHKMAFVIYVA